MKLRIRSSETKETIRVGISPSMTLGDLKALIAGRVSSSASSAAAPISPDAVHLSLNRRDELTATLPEETLQTLGLASGDLVFYTMDASAFSQPPSAPPTPAMAAAAPRGGVGSLPGCELEEQIPTVASILNEGEGSEVVSVVGHVQEEMTMSGRILEEESAVVADMMELDSRRVVEGVQGSEKANGDLDILVIAVHAVFLESGFVEHESRGVSMTEGWTSKASTVSISYTLPEITSPNFYAAVDKVELKILLVGKFADVYGCLTGSSDIYRLCLDASKFVPSIVSYMNSMSEEDEKDKLSLPLLMDMCYKNRLPPPPCFICLPTELKIRILELVPGADLARAACVNSELRYLSSNEDLWKQKFMAEFPGREACDLRGNVGTRWKYRFATYWEDQKRNKRHREVSSIYQYAVPPLRRRDPAPFFNPVPNVLGGDYDRFPAFGSLYPGRSRQARSPILRGQSFIPHCNLGGFDA
ncbi:unnamed protein product [Spirodela intermedia]|uniref:F-box domain-containing protein n=1 Tax=Spirodela intermedia TaxID=51605 RepID=A0A7I8I986_SPIIN|nr:unnamed protein product [Spirodela intermedia]CAA6653481.1 unnamed protein product [Spirodela intermedia]